MLSFCKKTEDGVIIDVKTNLEKTSSTEMRRTSNEFGSSKSLTSIDVKKSRRTSSTLQRTPAQTKTSLLKSASFSTKENNTKYEELSARDLRSPENPGKINKLILRVPSAAHEHENKKVFYSVCNDDDFEAEKRNTQNVNEPKLEIGNQKNLNSSSNEVASGGVCVISDLIDSNVFDVNKEEAIRNLISAERDFTNKWEKSNSTTNLVALTPKARPIFRRRDFSAKSN